MMILQEAMTANSSSKKYCTDALQFTSPEPENLICFQESFYQERARAS